MISFIILNYKTKELTCKCIEDILKNKTLEEKEYEIIVVDNNSQDGSIEYIKHKFSDVNVIENKENMGFGNGNNVGVKNANGKYLILLNSDVFIKDTNLNELLENIENIKNIGLLGCKVLNADSTIQSVGYKYPNIAREIRRNLLLWDYKFIKNIRYKNYSNKGLFRTDWISGCFIVCEKDVYESVGGFDEKIFMYSEDIDLCARLNKLGRENYVNDEVSVYHLHGKSGNKKTPSLKHVLSLKKSFYYVLDKNKLCGGIWIIKLLNTLHLTMLCSVKNIINLIK